MPQRSEIHIGAECYAPHRHDSYVFALTLSGAQCFDYRGESRVSQRGELVVLHPDEKHDGRAGTPDGFCYRGIAIDPADLQPALGYRPLPFISGGVTRDRRLMGVVAALLDDCHMPLCADRYEAALVELADALAESGGYRPVLATRNRRAARQAREIILDHPDQNVSLAELEAATGENRWQLSRDFSALFGTSPYRFVQLRRLEAACAGLDQGQAIADAAYAAGFADQSHLSRQFKQAYGVTPRTWLRMRAARTIVQ
ncbi:AraC family transcriptional regulator [Hyphobacterium sp.]|uniref:AraC family transcriptional regulator n=1 Tax=Hyphobacterium sp. TaxID=2004662 RepID=UPI003B52A060